MKARWLPIRAEYAIVICVALLLLAYHWRSVRPWKVNGRAAQDSVLNTVQAAAADPVQFTKNRFTGGIGAALSIDAVSGLPVVNGVIPGSPAEIAGLKPDDLLVEVDGKPTKGMPMIDTIEAIRGITFGKVRLLVQRSGTNLLLVSDRASWNELNRAANLQDPIVVPVVPLPNPKFQPKILSGDPLHLIPDPLRLPTDSLHLPPDPLD